MKKFSLLLLASFFFSSCHQARTSVQYEQALSSPYVPWGVGGGGAMSGISISPFSNQWFVGTDMGTLFRSDNQGQSWEPVNHHQAVFSSDLSRSVSLGFSADGKTLFYSSGGTNPQKSEDGGRTFSSLALPLKNGEVIKIWYTDTKVPSRIFCGTTKGLLISENMGKTWRRVKGITSEAISTFIDHGAPKRPIYHATKYRIWISTDGGKRFKDFYTPKRHSIRQFTGGRDSSGLTLAYLDNLGKSACKWVHDHEATKDEVKNTINSCGHVRVSTKGKNFRLTKQIAGDHLQMAENDASTIYTTGGKKWIRQYGTKVHVSSDKGRTWDLKLHQLNWDVVPFEPWPQSRLEYSAVALDVGWWDSGYESFDIHRLNSEVIAGTGYFFLLSSKDGGESWQSPFTRFMDEGDPAPMSRWRTTGIEVISVYRSKFHPQNPNLFYAASADVGGMVSDDHGKSFRIINPGHNSIYDFAFDEKHENHVYVAAGNSHDFPNEWHANAIKSAGGLYLSHDRGKNWTRLTPDTDEFNRQFLSVAYDSKRKVIYGGTHEVGILMSRDQGRSWQYLNEGLPPGNKIIPQMEINPQTGNVYALLTGNAPEFSNISSTGIYFLDVDRNSPKWILLRGTVHPPTKYRPPLKLWSYPTAFALDYSKGDEPTTLWLVDYENNGNWLQTGVWKSMDRGKNWKRMKQVTHATDIKLDPKFPHKVYVSGYYKLDDSWGDGGQLSSKDGGQTWIRNHLPPLQHNARGVALDPLHPNQIIYNYFGGGMLYGPAP